MIDFINGITIVISLVILALLTGLWKYIGVQLKKGKEPALVTVEVMQQFRKGLGIFILIYLAMFLAGLSYLFLKKPDPVYVMPQTTPTVTVVEKAKTTFDKELFKLCLSESKTKNGISADVINACSSAAKLE